MCCQMDGDSHMGKYNEIWKVWTTTKRCLKVNFIYFSKTDNLPEAIIVVVTL